MLVLVDRNPETGVDDMSGRGEGSRSGTRGYQSGDASRGRGKSFRQGGHNLSLYMFVTRDREPRHQHDMRAFVMAARAHARTGKLSEVSIVHTMCVEGVLTMFEISLGHLSRSVAAGIVRLRNAVSF